MLLGSLLAAAARGDAQARERCAANLQRFREGVNGAVVDAYDAPVRRRQEVGNDVVLIH